ncbi:MAG: LPS assembly lipoprotein LptE [Cytophagales bacterium]|nr:LPS assembly lipoprotein LptE [Cytophagales bacterium]
MTYAKKTKTIIKKIFAGKWKMYAGLLAVSAVLFACSVSYTFTGSNINYDVTKTISISFFYNESGLGPATASQDFTNKLRDYFQQNTSLALVEEDGDLQIEGSITGFDYTPLAPQSRSDNSAFANTDQAGVERLTVRVTASFVDTNNDQYDFESRSFSQFADYNTNSQTREAAEQGLSEEIYDKLVQDIFNATVANW